jgi:hypothetical protein
MAGDDNVSLTALNSLISVGMRNASALGFCASETRFRPWRRPGLARPLVNEN